MSANQLIRAYIDASAAYDRAVKASCDSEDLDRLYRAMTAAHDAWERACSMPSAEPAVAIPGG